MIASSGSSTSRTPQRSASAQKTAPLELPLVGELVEEDQHSAARSAGTNRGFGLLMASTPLASPQVLSRRFAYFRVIRISVSAVQADFCAEFDSRQLHR